MSQRQSRKRARQSNTADDESAEEDSAVNSEAVEEEAAEDDEEEEEEDANYASDSEPLGDDSPESPTWRSTWRSSGSQQLPTGTPVWGPGAPLPCYLPSTCDDDATDGEADHEHYCRFCLSTDDLPQAARQHRKRICPSVQVRVQSMAVININALTVCVCQYAKRFLKKITT